MRLRANLDEYASLAASDQQFVPSPAAGVERILLDRIGDEVAVATSIVRYAEGSRFPSHEHAGGEEFIVLDGVFSDEHRDHPSWSYVRNPPGTQHAPYSEAGCTIFVKLRQFEPEDLTPVVMNINQEIPAAGFELDELYRHGAEVVQVLRCAEGERVALPASSEAREGFVLSGAVSWQVDVTHTFEAWSWFRVPPGCPFRLNTLAPSIVFTKTRPKPTTESG